MGKILEKWLIARTQKITACELLEKRKKPPHRKAFSSY